jgi:hypothetical protein
LSDSAPIFELPKEEGNWALRMLGLASASAPVTMVPRPVSALARALAPLTVHGLDWPLARMELVPVE